MNPARSKSATNWRILRGTRAKLSAHCPPRQPQTPSADARHHFAALGLGEDIGTVEPGQKVAGGRAASGSDTPGQAFQSIRTLKVRTRSEVIERALGFDGVEFFGFPVHGEFDDFEAVGGGGEEFALGGGMEIDGRVLFQGVAERADGGGEFM